MWYISRVRVVAWTATNKQRNNIQDKNKLQNTRPHFSLYEKKSLQLNLWDISLNWSIQMFDNNTNKPQITRSKTKSQKRNN